MRSGLAVLALLLSLLALGLEVGTSLGHPRLWNDEGETAMYAERVLRFGYPAIDDGWNVVFECSCPREVGARGNVYVGSTWGQYFLGAAGAAWGHGAASDVARTARLRAPFAAAGFLGVLLAAGSAASFFGEQRTRWLAAASVVALCALSLPLVLHLRQARHQGPDVLLAVAAVALHLRRWARGIGGLRLELLEALCLVLLWHMFHPAALLLAGALVAERGLAVARRERGLLRIAGCLLRESRAVWLAALIVAPAALYWRPFAIAAAIRPHPPLTAASYLHHLDDVCLRIFALRDSLVPALVAIAMAALARARGLLDTAERTRLAAAVSLVAVCGLYVVVLCTFPVLFTRYAVALSPLLAMATVLAAGAVARSARTLSRPAVAVLAACTAAWLAWAGPTRLGELRGFVGSLLDPPSGPIDAAVDALRARYPHPEALTIATSYEVPSLQWYLGARVSEGPFDAAPDVLIPRRHWPYGHAEILRWHDAGGYLPLELAVADWPWNDIPELLPAGAAPAHRFTTPRAGVDGPPLVLFVRSAGP